MVVGNTHASDLNELALTFALNGQQWDKRDHRRIFREKSTLVDDIERTQQLTRAYRMSKEIHAYVKGHYHADITKAHWVSRGTSLAKLLNRPIDPKSNPTDILLELDDGSHIGISAKSTHKTSGNIGFKNPGLSTIERIIRRPLLHHLQAAETQLFTQFPDVPRELIARKPYIRARAEVHMVAQALGDSVLSNIRDAYGMVLQGWPTERMAMHLTQDWFTCDADLQGIPYLKVTGSGNDAQCKVLIEDPQMDLERINAAQHFEIDTLGHHSLGVLMDGERLLRIRAKFTNEKLGSSIKFSAEMWV